MAFHGESALIRGRQFGASNEKSPLGLPRGGELFGFSEGFEVTIFAIEYEGAPLVVRLHEVPRASVAREARAVRA